MTPTAVAMRDITKTFPGLYQPVVANAEVNLSVDEGEFHVIVGENGAGKSTLMNILYGLHRPDSGHISLFGVAAELTSPRQAIARGVGMIHQHFMLVPSFTVADNIVLGHEPIRGGLMDRARIWRDIEALATRLNLPIDPRSRIEDLSVGLQQRVEILKALYRGARILILDEPTAVLTPQETDQLFAALAELRREGTTVIMITHKLPEVMAVADRVTVMRDGRVVAARSRGEFDERGLADLMTGRQWEPTRLPRGEPAASTRDVLVVQDLSCRDDRGVEAVRNVSFSLRAGEILAIAGVAHNGQEELAETLMGQRPRSGGRVIVAGTDATGLSVRDIRALGSGHVPDDRNREGCAPAESVLRNMIMGAHRRPPLARGLAIDQRAARQWALGLVADYRIKVSHLDAPIRSLSGGNVQKAIVAREIAMTRHCLIAEQPSRGVDIGAAEAIYERLMRLRDSGAGVLLISMDLTETLRLADRILVMYGGRIVGERLPGQTDQRDLGRLMAGVSDMAGAVP